MIGEQFGQYQIKDVIGRGGMSTVYRAYQPAVDRDVALKVLLHDIADNPKLLSRFQQEARVVANLEHRAIVPVYDFGEYRGLPYIVMRLLDGGTLRKKLYYEYITLSESARIVGEVAQALDYAHERGVIHRDLKPSNIMLDSQGSAYLTDFGIARIIGSATDNTDTKGVVGTPSYMSPEQCQGKELNGASDVYSLGVILFEMVTGETPYQADTPLAVMYMHVRDPIPSVLAYDPTTPYEVAEVIQRAMAKKPEQRYPNAVALAQAFRQAIEAPVQDLPVGVETGTMPRPPKPPPDEDMPGQELYVGPPTGYADPLNLPDDEEAAGAGLYGDPYANYDPRYADPYFTGEGHPPPTDITTEESEAIGGRPARSGRVVAAIVGVVLFLMLAGGGVLLAASLGSGSQSGGVGPTLPPPSTPATIVIVTEVPSTGDGGPGDATPTPTAADEGIGGGGVDPTATTAPPTSTARPATQAPAAVATNTNPPPAVIPTFTPVPPTPTFTLPPPTATFTAPPPTATFTVAPPTATPTATATVPTATPTFTATPVTPTATVTPEATDTPTATATQPVSSDGRLLVFTEGEGPAARIIRTDGTGANQAVLADNAFYDGEPDLSPNGQRIAFISEAPGVGNIYLMDINGENRERLTSALDPENHPDWSPTGQAIVFERGRDEDADLFVVEVASGVVTRLTNNDFGDRAPAFDPTGTRIAYMTQERGSWEIAIMAYPSGSQLQIFDCPEANCRFPAWSPDGSRIAFNTIRESGTIGPIYAVNVSSGESTLLIETDRSGRADYTADGAYIYFNRTVEGIAQIFRYVISGGTVEQITSGGTDRYGPSIGRAP